LLNPYATKNFAITSIRRETKDCKLFRLEPGLSFSPGQFVLASVPGFGEAPFVPCSQPDDNKSFKLLIRKVGRLTSKLHTLKKGDSLGLRGPYGHGWLTDESPITNNKSRNLLLIAGGLGLVPLRSLILQQVQHKILDAKYKIQVLYGAKSPDEFIFKKDYAGWKKQFDFHITIDKPVPSWKGCTGLITSLLDKVALLKNPLCLLAGPPIMYKFVLKKLTEHKIPAKDIFLSLERRMHCGLGVCQHCALGDKFVCKHGPVFCWQEIKDIYEFM